MAHTSTNTSIAAANHVDDEDENLADYKCSNISVVTRLHTMILGIPANMQDVTFKMIRLVYRISTVGRFL
jgi:hypothetical protein